METDAIRLAGQPASCGGHAVQFYEDERFLCRTVADFLAAGLATGEAAVVIATSAHRQAFAHELTERGLDVDAACSTGRLTLLDARETLGSFMTGNMPDPDRFSTIIGNLIASRLRESGRPSLRAYGEMVDLLWKDDKPEGAIRLEELWTDLAGVHAFSLLCAYEMGNFRQQRDAGSFDEICRRHSHVIPAETYPLAEDEDSRRREISRLQQRARALETEIAQRKVLERRLRDALEARERAERERQLLLIREQEARAEVETASRLKDEFLTVLSHELRTPLHAILGWTQILNSGAANAAIARRALEVIGRNAAVQLRLVDDLLDVSRMVAGRMQIGAEPVDLMAVVAAALDSIRPAAAAKNIDLDVHIDGRVPAVLGDASRLQQVVWNLLSNAVKFTSPPGRVELRLNRSDCDAEIVVRDTGQGIAPEFLPHVFDRFRQADTGTTRQYSGLGLGLSVVAYLVEAHRGTIRAESAGPGRGATFIVRLPLHPVSTMAGRKTAPTQEPVLKNARVLVVDGERDSRELFEYVLEQAGAVVESVPAPAEALRRLTAQGFNVLVADMALAEQDGYSLIASVRAHPDPAVRGICAVAATAGSGDGCEAKALGAGYDDYVPRPVDAARLGRVIAGLLDRATAGQLQA